MKTFDDLVFEPKFSSDYKSRIYSNVSDLCDEDMQYLEKMTSGKQAKMQFDNGYGVSVIDDGYGKEKGLYELAVLDSECHLCYSTPITSDVLGWLTKEDVTEYMKQVQELDTQEKTRFDYVFEAMNK